MTEYIYAERRIHPEEKCKQIAEKLADFGCATPKELVQMVEDPDLEAAISELLNGFGPATVHKILTSSPGTQQCPHHAALKTLQVRLVYSTLFAIVLFAIVSAYHCLCLPLSLLTVCDTCHALSAQLLPLPFSSFRCLSLSLNSASELFRTSLSLPLYLLL